MRQDADWNQRVHIRHHGTFNANPLSAAAGAAMLNIVKTGEPHRVANRLAERLRDGMNEAIERHKARGFVYGDTSLFHIYFGSEAEVGRPARHLTAMSASALKGMPRTTTSGLKRALVQNGVDLLGTDQHRRRDAA